MSALSYQRFMCEQADAIHLVLIHGWGLHSGVWDKVIEPLRAFAHVTVIDRAGYGTSPMMTLAKEQQAILTIAPPCAIYIGWSLGGAIVIDMAIQYPERVMAVVAVATNPCFLQRDDWHCAMSSADFGFFLDSVRASAYVALVRFMGLQCQGSATQREDMRFLQGQLEKCPIPHRDVLLNGLKELFAADIRIALQYLHCPILWMMGGKDSLAKVDVDALVALNPLIAVNTISEAAHVPFVSHPELFVSTIKRFLHGLQNDIF
jgi:pimeloyl-[acyl-carrier protein] methyl ester esterase